MWFGIFSPKMVYPKIVVSRQEMPEIAIPRIIFTGNVDALQISGINRI